MNENKEVRVSKVELYMLAADEVMENMPMSNKDFNPRDKDECIDLLMKMVAREELSIEWIESVATANLSNVHTVIDYKLDKAWSYMGGMSKAKFSREDFLKQVEETHLAMKSGKIKVQDKYGKQYFNAGAKK